MGINVPALAAPWPSTSTCPARISARAFSRDSTRPFSTRSVSRRCLRFPVNDPARDVGEARVEEAGAIECLVGVTATLAGKLARPIEAEERGIGRLTGGAVLAGGLAERGRRTLFIQDVVDNLKSETDLRRVLIQRRKQRVGRAAH